jgi:hypothetical protein
MRAQETVRQLSALPGPRLLEAAPSGTLENRELRRAVYLNA